MLNNKYDFTISEAKWQKFWEEDKIYRFDVKATKEIYSIDTPPPTVSGSLHIGHIFSYTQAEMIARFHRMQGKNVFYPFGFDDNGLPTERLVEREYGIFARDLQRSEFNEKCIKTTKKYEKQFKALWQALGFSVDWELQYETISPLTQKISQKSFIELYKKGKAYLNEMPVLWCTNCRTSIAQAELDSTQRDTAFNWIPFMSGEDSLIVATTRPELLYGCVALFIHPDDERFNKYIGGEAVVPLYDFKIPILGDKRVSMDKGTGIVMCSTFGDTTDLEWYKEHRLPYRKVIEPDGRISSNVPYIHDMEVNDARAKTIEILKKRGLLIKSEKMVHTVAIHERCGKDIEIIPSRQWYIDILSEKDRFLEAADEVNWYPSLMKDRYVNWVKNLKWDWCISRQRYFGIPFPVWYCKKCGAVKLAREEDLPINPIEADFTESCICGGREFEPEKSVMDTWATSSLTPIINAKWEETDDITGKLIPMSMRTQAHDIIRTWAFYTIVKSLYHTGKVPWKDIMICGFVMAKKGEKISKSKSNSSQSPMGLIEKYSADAIRYWAANARLGTDTTFSEEELQGSRKFLTKLWNAARFCFMHLEDYRGEIPQEIMPVDKWIMEREKEVAKQAAVLLNEYESGEARHTIDEFFWKDFCDNYLEIVKERLYQPEVHGEENRISALYAIYQSLLGILKLYAIYVPHITEEIYQTYYRAIEQTKSIHIHLWNITEQQNDDILKFGERIKDILTHVRKFKSERNLSLKSPLKKIQIFIPDCNFKMFHSSEKDLIACTRVQSIELIRSEHFRVIIE